MQEYQVVQAQTLRKGDILANYGKVTGVYTYTSKDCYTDVRAGGAGRTFGNTELVVIEKRPEWAITHDTTGYSVREGDAWRATFQDENDAENYITLKNAGK